MKATKEEIVTLIKFVCCPFQMELMDKARELVEAYAKACRGVLSAQVCDYGVLVAHCEGHPLLHVKYVAYARMTYGDISKEVKPETVGIWYELMPKLSKATTEDKQLLDKVAYRIKKGRFDEARNLVMVSKL